MDGRKLNSSYENPIDNILINICNYIGKILSRYPFFTPNVFTTLSLIIALLGTYYVYKKSYKIGALLIFLGYFFDCLDGNFARSYNMVSDFGDKYDHIADSIKFIILIFVLLFSKLKKNTKILFIVIYITSGLLAMMHLGCQEQHSSQKTVLDYLQFLCSKKTNIIWTRYFGGGTHMFLICLFIYNITYINRLMD